MANFFDQFDSSKSEGDKAARGNFFDQFDAPEKDPGYLGEIGRGLKAGAQVQLPKMAGQALKFFGAEETGDSLIAGAEARNTPDLQESAAGQAQTSPFSVRGSVYEAASNAVPSLAPGAAGAAVGAVVGSVVPVLGTAAGALIGYAAGSIASLPMFYGSQAQESYEAVKKTQIEAGKSEAEADAIATRTAHAEGAIEAGGELAADVIPFAKLFKPLARPAAKAAGSLVKDTLFPAFKQAAITTAQTVGGEVATEMAQQAGEDYVRKEMGDTGPGATWDETAKVIMPTALMSLIPGAGGAAAVHVKRKMAVSTLVDPEADPEARSKVALGVAGALEPVDPNLSRAFAGYAAEQIKAGQPIEIGPDALYTAKAQPVLALPAPVVAGQAGESIEAQTARQAAIDAAETNAAKVYAERAEVEATRRVLGADSINEAIQAADQGAAFEADIADSVALGLVKNQIGKAVTTAGRLADEQAARDRDFDAMQAARRDAEAQAAIAESERRDSDGPAKTAMQVAFEKATLKALEARERMQSSGENTQSNQGAGKSESLPAENAAPSDVRLFGKPIAGLTDQDLAAAAQRHPMSAFRASAEAERARRAALVPAQAQETPAPAVASAAPAQLQTAVAPSQPTPSSTATAAPPALAATVEPASTPPSVPLAAPSTAPQQPTKPVLIFGRTVDKLTRKELEVSAKKARAAAQREAAAAEIERRADEKLARPLSPAEETRRAGLRQQAAQRKRIDVDRDSLIHAVIKLGGISPKERQDITGDTNGDNPAVMGVGYLFSSTGSGTDDVATRLGQYGYLSQEELADVDGGVQALKDKIADELRGARKHWSTSGKAYEREAAARAVAEDAEALERDRPPSWATMTEEEKDEHLDAIFGADSRPKPAAGGQETRARAPAPEVGPAEQVAGEREPGQDDEEVDAERNGNAARPSSDTGGARGADGAVGVDRGIREQPSAAVRSGVRVDQPAHAPVQKPEVADFNVGENAAPTAAGQPHAKAEEVPAGRPQLDLARQSEADLKAKAKQAATGTAEERAAAVRDRNEAILTPPEGTAPARDVAEQKVPTQQEGLFGAAAALRSAAEAIEKAVKPKPEGLPARTADTMSDAIAMSSPSGRMSKRAQAAASARLGKALFGEAGLQREETRQPSERERLLAQAKNLRELAARGMNTKSYIREAEKLEAQARALDIEKPTASESETNVAEAKDASADIRSALNSALSEEERADAARELGDKEWSGETAAKFLVRYAEWLQQGAKDIRTALGKLFQKVLSATRAGVLSIAVAANFNAAKPADTLPVTPTKTQIQLSIERPKADFKGVEASADAKFVADWTVRNKRNDGAPFIIADKPHGFMYAFDENGALLAKAPAIFGQAKGDTISKEMAEKTADEMSKADKVTPSGEFRATRDTAYGAPSLRVAEYPGGPISLHQVYVGSPSENRVERLSSENAEDKRISYGCINALPEFIDGVLAPYFKGNNLITILPETTDAKSLFGINDSAYETKTVSVGSEQSAGEVSWGAGKYAREEKPARGQRSPAARRRGPMFSRQADNIDAYKPQRGEDKNGQPAFANREIIIARGRPDPISRGEGVRSYQWTLYDRTKPGEKGGRYLKVGELYADLTPDGKFEMLRSITIFNRFQGSGYGESVVASMLAHNGPGYRMGIENIQHHTIREDDNALPFWQKLGTRLHNYATDPNVEINGDLALADYLRAREGKGTFFRDGQAQAAKNQPAGRQEGPRGNARAREAGTEDRAGREGVPGRPDGADETVGDARAYRRAPGRYETLAPDDVRRIIAPILKNWGNAPEVRVISSVDEAPAAVQRMDVEQREGGAKGEPEAFINAGTVYLVANGLSSEAAVVRALFHESFGHYGLKGVLGDRIVTVLNEVVKSAPKRVEAKAKEYGLNWENEDAKLIAAEEVLAEIAQSRPTLGIVRRAIAIVRQFLRELGIKIDLSENDIINEFILPARRFVTEGRPRGWTGSGAAFSRAPAAAPGAPTYTVPTWAEGFDAAKKEALRKAGVIFHQETLKDRARSLTKDFGKTFVQGVVDQFAPLKDLDPIAYMKARLSRATDGGVEALLMYGKPFLRDGAIDVDARNGGFLKVLQGLKNEHDRFFAWVAGMRAGELKAKGKENLLTDEDLSFLRTLDRSDAAWTGRQEAYAAALRQLQAYNKAVLDIAEKQGIIDGESRPLWESQFYVPFYRAMEDGVAGPTVKSGLVRQYAFKKLKGGTQDLNDLTKNTLMNWSHLLSASQKNAAAKAAIDAAVRVGVAVEADEESARQMGKSIGNKRGVVNYLENGLQRWFVVDDPHILDAITSLEFAGFGPWMKPMAAFKRWLTFGVTANPAFKIRNLIRDSLAAIGQNPVSYNVFKNIAQGWKGTEHLSQTRASLMAGGGMFRFGTILEGDRAQHLKELIESGVSEDTVLDTADKVKAFFRKTWDKYQEFGDRSENINRAALYEQLIKQGKNHLEASYLARDMLDFSMSGKWAAIRFLTQSVPFMNARLQGLYKLGRAVKEDPARAGYVTGAIALASLALLIGNEDDDDWKKREDWDRDTYWWFKFGGVAFRIPKPFELGAIGTIVERTYELAFNKEMSGKRYGQRMADILSQNFSMSPVPQLVKPLVDLYANQDSFSGRPIETMGMERLRKQDRYTEHTTYAARAIGLLGIPDPLQLMQGRYEGISPAQADFLIRGYFGWMGTMASTAADYGVRPLAGAPEKPSMQLRDVFLAGNFVESLPTGSSRYVTDFYNQAKEIEQAYGSYREALKQGDVAKARDIFEAEREKIAKYKSVEAVKRIESQITSKIHRIEDSNAPAEDKRRLIDMLERQKDLAARRITAAH